MDYHDVSDLIREVFESKGETTIEQILSPVDVNLWGTKAVVFDEDAQMRITHRFVVGSEYSIYAYIKKDFTYDSLKFLLLKMKENKERKVKEITFWTNCEETRKD